MSQNPLSATTAMQKVGSAYVQKQVLVGPSNEIIGTNGGVSSLLNIAAATVVKSGVGRIVKVSVTVAGAVGNIYDSASTTGNSATNLIAVIPAVVGVYTLEWPVGTGIVIAPGAAQVVSVSYM